MRYLSFFFFIALLSVFTVVHAQKVQTADSIIYRDAAQLAVYGKAHADDVPRYRRLPAAMDTVVREPLRRLGCNSAGLYVRFCTDAPDIYVRWSNTGYTMSHMTNCGVGGLDLYALIDGSWLFVGSAFDRCDADHTEHERCIVANMEPMKREYMLYLSLYDEVKTLEIGVAEDYVVEPSTLNSPRSESPVVMYGTSILQGGCASRPGMAHTNIIARRLDRTVINLGFSGNAFLDYDIARLMASVAQPSVFVLDYVPNAKVDTIALKGETFYRILRKAHPEVPIVFVEDPQFAHSVVNNKVADEIASRNRAQHELYERLLRDGERNIYYVGSEGMTEQEDFVDGTHFTDLGMTHYADHLTPILKGILSAEK